MPATTRIPLRSLAAAGLAIGMAFSLAACTDSGSGGSNTSAWCDDFKAFDQLTSQEGALSNEATLEQIRTDIQALTDSAPADIADEITAYTKASLTNLDNMGTGTETDEATTQAIIQSGYNVNLYVKDNCGGYIIGGGDEEEEG